MSEYIAKCNEVEGIIGKTLIVPDYIDTSEEIVRCRDCKFYSQEQPTEISGIFKVKHPAKIVQPFWSILQASETSL